MPHGPVPATSTSISLSAPQIIDDPQTLSGLFPPDSDDDDGDSVDGDDVNNVNQNCYEIQSIQIVGETIQIRQYDYHSHNANRIWPGSFPLAEYLLQQEHSTTSFASTVTFTPSESDCRSDGKYVHQWGRILELGTATGLLSIRLAMACSEMNPNHKNCCCTSIVTSDVDDEYGDIASNLIYNYTLNRMKPPFPYHIPHTWGTGFQQCIQNVIDKEMACDSESDIATTNTAATIRTASKSTAPISNRKHPLYVPFDTIIASDILLYVSAYPALVQTLSELMIPSILQTSEHDTDFDNHAPQPPTQPSSLRVATTATTTSTTAPIPFIMSWNRRLKESQEFFVRMTDAGFIYEHHGRGIYTFVYDNHHQKK